MKDLFIYGALMDSSLMDDVAGCILPREKGVLHGYGCYAIKGTEYKGVMIEEGNTVEGVIYYNVPRIAIKRIDQFWGENFVRDTVIIQLAKDRIIEAEVYVIKTNATVMLENYKRERHGMFNNF